MLYTIFLSNDQILIRVVVIQNGLVACINQLDCGMSALQRLAMPTNLFMDNVLFL